jgi:hypothetical protein
MATKQLKLSEQSADGSIYGTLTNGNGTLVVTTTSGTGHVKQINPGSYAPDGSLYLTLTDGNGNLV